MSKYLASIVIPSYIPDQEVDEVSQRFFNSLWPAISVSGTTGGLRRKDVQLICVDNGSPREFQLPSSVFDVYVHRDRPLGYARAVNIGLSLADGQYVFVLNNDLVFQPGDDWIGKLIKTYEQPGVGPGVLSAMDTSQSSCIGVTYDDSWYSLWMSSKRTVQHIGYLDEHLPYRFHDQDYSIRAHKLGYRVLRTGNVVVEHKEATTYKKMAWVDEEKERAAMVEKHGVATYREWREAGGRGLGR